MITLRVLYRCCAATLAGGSLVGMIALAACGGNDKNTPTNGRSTSQLADPDASCNCPTGFTACTVTDGVVACVDTSFDPSNCGACGNACDFGQFCSDGACTGTPPPPDAGFTCPSPLISCPFDGVSACVNPAIDPTNCGACGNTCAFGQFCTNGTCTGTPIDAGGTCSAPFTACPFGGGTACVNTAIDPTNCGGCGNTCAFGQICSSGTCTGTVVDAGITCLPPFTACPFGGAEACVNTAFDPNNCGRCGNTCAFGQFCSNGTCTGTAIDAGITCPTGTTACPFGGTTACVSTAIDPTNCGACGVTCAFGQFCSNGVCTGTAVDAGITCFAPFIACPFGGSTACVNPTIDTTNCGACGVTCAFGQICNSGVCTSIGASVTGVDPDPAHCNTNIGRFLQ